MPLSDIVNVVITRNTQGIAEPGFGVMMILGSSQRFAERIRFYSSIDEVAGDFQPTDPEYIAAQDAFSQPIRPSQIAIGRRAMDSAVLSVITALDGQSYSVTINGQTITASSTPTTFNSTITMDADFVTGNSIQSTLNGVSLPAVPFTNNSQLDTMNAWIAEIISQPNISSAQLDPADPTNRTLIVQGLPGYSAEFDPIPVVTGGASQPVATVTTQVQEASPETIAATLVAAINNYSPSLPVTAVDELDGTFRLDADVPSTPFTVSASTDIQNPDQYLVTVTQAYPSTDYEVRVNGVGTTITTTAGIQNNESIATQLVAGINATMAANNIPVVASDNSNGSLSLSANNPGDGFSVSVTPNIMSVQSGLVVLPIQPSASVTSDLDAIQLENPNWYAIVSTDRSQATVLEIAAWTQPRIKLFGIASSEQEIINLPPGETTSIAAKLNIAGYDRTFVMYHQDADSDYPEAAWFGRVLPLEPGSETWKFKTLNGVPYSNLTTTQSNNARGKKANTYELIAGVRITQEGTVASGEFIDIIRGIDWLTSTMQIYVYSVLVNNNKVPYTDAGIAAIEAQVRRALQQGIDQQFIAEDPAPVVTVPRVADVAPNDKANRILRNVRFTATLSGAIHYVRINGVVSV